MSFGNVTAQNMPLSGLEPAALLHAPNGDLESAVSSGGEDVGNGPCHAGRSSFATPADESSQAALQTVVAAQEASRASIDPEPHSSKRSNGSSSHGDVHAGGTARRDNCDCLSAAGEVSGTSQSEQQDRHNSEAHALDVREDCGPGVAYASVWQRDSSSSQSLQLATAEAARGKCVLDDSFNSASRQCLASSQYGAASQSTMTAGVTYRPDYGHASDVQPGVYNLKQLRQLSLPALERLAASGQLSRCMAPRPSQEALAARPHQPRLRHSSAMSADLTLTTLPAPPRAVSAAPWHLQARSFSPHSQLATVLASALHYHSTHV